MKTAYLKPLIISTLVLTLMSAGCTMSKSDMTPAAQTTLDSRFPDAEIDEVEGRLGQLYDVELQHNGQEVEVKLHQNGTLVEVETELEESNLPEAVAKTVAEKAKDHELTEVEMVQIFSRNTLGGIDELEQPEVYYEVEWKVLVFVREIKVNPDGTIR